jgi:hypothetical protein
MERLIDGQPVDRRKRYEAKMEAQGFVRTTMRVPPNDLDFMKTLARHLRAGETMDRATLLAARGHPESTLGMELGRMERTERSEGAPSGRSAKYG